MCDGLCLARSLIEVAPSPAVPLTGVNEGKEDEIQDIQTSSDEDDFPCERWDVFLGIEVLNSWHLCEIQKVETDQQGN